jgi:hypothetical protein
MKTIDILNELQEWCSLKLAVAMGEERGYKQHPSSFLNSEELIVAAREKQQTLKLVHAEIEYLKFKYSL